MKGPGRSGPTSARGAGEDRRWRPSPGLLIVALAIVAGGLAVLAMPLSSPEPVTTAATTPSPPADAVRSSPDLAQAPAAVEASSAVVIGPSPHAAASASLPAPAPEVARQRDPNGDLTPDLADYVNSGERPSMGEVIERLHRAGVHTGLGAFSPPGTRPPLIGLAVPEDFVLPEGYVRHYQATDDGQRIEPILMFAPDHRFFDAANRPIAIPKDRVVPPELAPPGMPIRRIVVPTPIDAGK